MTAEAKTRNLVRTSLPTESLVPNESNPNEMTQREFDLLVDNMEAVGITDPIYVLPFDVDAFQELFKKSGKKPDRLCDLVRQENFRFTIIGGHHRWRAAEYLRIQEVPCTVNVDKDFTQEQADMQMVRHNVIHGKMSPQKFMVAYEKYLTKYGEELLQDMLGFANEAEFRKLVASTAEQLPPEMQDKFKAAAVEIKTIDGLSQLLNSLFTKYGDTLPYGYMFLDYGGKQSIWMRVTSKTMDAVRTLADVCIENQRTMDDIVGGVLQLIAKGEFKEEVKSIVESTPVVVIPEGMQTLPTKDNTDNYKAL